MTLGTEVRYLGTKTSHLLVRHAGWSDMPAILARLPHQITQRIIPA